MNSFLQRVQMQLRVVLDYSLVFSAVLVTWEGRDEHAHLRSVSGIVGIDGSASICARKDVRALSLFDIQR
jgi:hypothetical protein